MEFDDNVRFEPLGRPVMRSSRSVGWPKNMESLRRHTGPRWGRTWIGRGGDDNSPASLAACSRSACVREPVAHQRQQHFARQAARVCSGFDDSDDVGESSRIGNSPAPASA